MAEGFLKKVKDEIEKTIESVEPMAGDPQGPDVTLVAEAEGWEPGDHSPAAEEEAHRGD
jgi:hypothetical protein